MIGSVIRDKRGEDEEEGSEMTDKSDLAARAFWPCQLCPPILVIILATNIILVIILATNIILVIIFLTITILVIILVSNIILLIIFPSLTILVDILVTDTIPLRILTLKNNFKVSGDGPQFWFITKLGKASILTKGVKMHFETRS